MLKRKHSVFDRWKNPDHDHLAAHAFSSIDTGTPCRCKLLLKVVRKVFVKGVRVGVYFKIIFRQLRNNEAAVDFFKKKLVLWNRGVVFVDQPAFQLETAHLSGTFEQIRREPVHQDLCFFSKVFPELKKVRFAEKTAFDVTSHNL